MIVPALSLGAILLAGCIIMINYVHVCKVPAGSSSSAAILELTGIIRSGANTFMRREYKVIIPVVLLVATLFACFIEPQAGVTLLLGACMSSASCWLSMSAATHGNGNTVSIADTTRALNSTEKAAFRGGSVGGMSVHTFGLLGLLLTVTLNFQGILNPTNLGHGLLSNIACNPATARLTAYSLGCSLVAMFNRVAGGNFTKAADISADIVAKNRHDLPEDDSRMPNTIADFIGDNVNDVAGNCSDLLESFVATIVSCILTAVSLARVNGLSLETARATILYPIVLASGGLIACVIATVYISLHKGGDNPAHELDLATYVAAGLSLVTGFVAAKLLFDNVALSPSFYMGWISPWLSSTFGIISGVIIGKITEYYTGIDHNPVKTLARFAVEGPAFVFTKGDAIGFRSCLATISTIVAMILLSGIFCGVYGIAISAVGMLSFVGIMVSIDAFGPIADNAGGIAESCHLDSAVRTITDQLDATGNTTAAMGKGLAISSAAAATISLMISYVGSYNTSADAVLNAIDIFVVAGVILGGALVAYFCAMLTDNTIDSAYLMAKEGDRQLSIPGVLEGTVKPDYELLITMATDGALKKMLAPSVLALLVPVFGGLLFGPGFVGGLLLGATVVAIPLAIFASNSGGAFDNAKKLIESGQLEGHGKGSEAHKAAVAGDTAGDTRKDVVAVALDIFIKMMSTVANTLSPVFVSFHLF